MPAPPPSFLPHYAPDAPQLSGLYARHYHSGRGVYLSVILSLVGMLAALPFLGVDVSTTARGELRPKAAALSLTAAEGGRVLFTAFDDNVAVTKGDTLLVLATETLDGQVDHLNRRQTEVRELMADLNRLLLLSDGDYPELRTALYQRDYQDYRSKADEADLALAHANRQLERQHLLLESGTIARAEYEETEFNHATLLRRRSGLNDQQINLWTQELTRYQREADELAHDLYTLHLRTRQFVLIAPASGNLLRPAGLEVGSNVLPGQALGTLSPDGQLRLEAAVQPNDIGVLRVGGRVQLEVDAYDRGRWGTVGATITEIGRDARRVDGLTYFPVYCTLDAEALSLPSGYEGRLRKGMTATAHFRLGHRTLAQLLTDRISDWLDPTTTQSTLPDHE